MKLFILFLLSALIYIPEIEASDICAKFTTSLQTLNEIPKKRCSEIRDSKQCQDFYKSLAATTKEADITKRKLTCDKTAWDTMVSMAVPLPLKGSCQDGIADFALEIVNSFVGVGKALAANAEKNNAIIYKCAATPEGKKTMIDATLGMWPKMMQPKSIPANLAQQDCLSIKTWLDQIEHSEKNKLATELIPLVRKGAQLSPDQEEAALYLKPNFYQKNPKSKSISELAAGLMSDIGNTAMCYNSEYQTELYCNALATAATFVIPGLQGARVAQLEKLAVLAGKKMTTAEIDTLAQQAMRLSKIKGLSARQGLVDTVAVLNDSDRLSLASQIAGRELSSSEAAAILKAHNLPSSELLEKARILKEAGFNADEREVFMRSSVTGQATKTTGVKSMKEIVESLPDGATKFRLQGDLEMAKATPDVSAATNYFAKATKDLEDTIMTKKNPGQHDLGDVVYAAARYGSQIKDPAEIARAQQLVGAAYEKKLAQDVADLQMRYRRSGARFDAAEEAQAYVSNLRATPSSNGSLAKKAVNEASQFEADAIVNYLNKVKRWNLR